ncbi:MAG TPA: efflux RND transporter periplasmic adaptor subunit [Vicinamibacteria bacterium]|jgi:HlyD family secretion protein|nr:efflux RND transporter periplasmic adaptor subunit [Vicinamibacteria bacterium]
MRMRTLALSGIVGAVLIVTAGWQARGAAPAAPAAVGAPAAARVVAAEGRVVAYPGAEVKVGAERPGRLVRVVVQEGQTVHRGDLLAEIESEELRASLAEARAHVAETEAEARLADLARERRRQLFQEKIVAVHDLDQATRDLEIAQARRDTAGATVARYEAQLRKSRILAPISGTVTLRRVDEGQTVEAGDAAFTIADLSRLRVEGEAHEADAGAIAVGAPVIISAEGFPGRAWRGRVEEVPDSVTLRRLKPQDPSRPTDTRILAVKVAFSEPTPLKLGTTVELKIDPAPIP